MKRVLSAILAIILLMSLAACSDSSGGEVKDPSNVKSDTIAAEKVSIDETVLVDESGIKITAKSLDVDGMLGSELKLLIENDSGKDLTFQCLSASINGYMVETIMSVDVVNGKKANDSIVFMDSDLELCGISSIADIDLVFNVFDTNDWDTYLKTGHIQLKTSIADSFEYSYDDSGDLAYEGNGIRIVVKGLSDESFLGSNIIVYIENTSDTDITVQTRGVSVNGFMIDSIFSCNVDAGKRAVDSITLMDSDLEENGISSIDDVELSFHVFDFDGWDTIVDTDVVTITF